MSSYRRPLKIWDFVCSLQCRRFLWARNLVAKRRHVKTSPREEEMGQVKEGTYRTGYYFDSPQSSTVIKSKMVATTILRTRTRFCPPQKNACTAGYFVCEIYYWDLRTLNNAKPYFFLNEMNKKDLPAMYSTAFWYLFVVLMVFLALLRNRCYSFHRTNWRVQGLTFSQCKSLVDVSFPPLHPSCIV